MTAFIAYLRVSTDKQGQSGLGLEAQQDAVLKFAGAQHGIVGTFIEVESGRNCERPELSRALNACRVKGARLLIAKLDRLARDVHFISGLMKSDVKFVACDMPDADPFRLHIEAAIAEEEARKISARTKAALAAAKARGVRLGGWRGHVPSPAFGAAGNVAKRAAADARAQMLVPVIKELRETGIVSLNGLAGALNARGIQAPRGGPWRANQVSNLLKRAEAA